MFTLTRPNSYEQGGSCTMEDFIYHVCLTSITHSRRALPSRVICLHGDIALDECTFVRLMKQLVD